MADVIDIRGLDGVRALLAGLSGEIEGVSRKAQNKMAYELRRAEQEQMRADLDRPTPWSVRALVYKKAGETGGPGAPDTPGAAVYFNTPFGGPGLQETEWLGVQAVAGRTAGPRRSELAFQALGLIRPGVVWVPAPGAPVDAYGNVRGSTIQAILADLRRAPGPRRKYVAIGAPPECRAILAKGKGNGQWSPILLFVRRRTYRRRYDFDGRAAREVAVRFPALLAEQMDRVLAKSRAR